MASVYFSLAMTHRGDLGYDQPAAIADALEAEGHLIYRPWIEEDDPEQVFPRDIVAIHEADALVAFTDPPSISVGFEVGMASVLGRRVLLVDPPGATRSLFLLGLCSELTRVDFVDVPEGASPEAVAKLLNDKLKETP